jgi:putative transposase
VIVAVGVNGDGRREILGLDFGPFEAETFWIGFKWHLQKTNVLKHC